MIPAITELQAWPQWVLWRLEPGRDGRPCKVPYNPVHHRKASVSGPRSWTSHEIAELSAATHPGEYQGLGFVLTAGDPYVAFDLDGCVEPAVEASDAVQVHGGVVGGPAPDLVIAAWARALLDELNSYTEVTPSGRGLRILVRGSLPPHGRRRGPLEMYDARRFVTITGRHLPGTPTTIEDRPMELAAIHARVFGDVAELWPAELDGAAVEHQPVDLDRLDADRGPAPLTDADLALVAKAQAARNGTRFTALWTGQWRELGYPSQSEADLALASMLAFRCGGDPAHMDRLFRASGLMRPKWDTLRGRLTYGASTIRLALSRSMFGCQHSTSRPV